MKFIVKQQQLKLEAIPACIQLIEYNPDHYSFELFLEQQIQLVELVLFKVFPMSQETKLMVI